MKNPSKVAQAILSPSTVGQLKLALENLSDDLLVFQIEYGNLEGKSSWKRKETWRQWCRRMKKK